MHGKLLLTAVILCVVFALTCLNPAATTPAAEKMKLEELIAKHLDSIGTEAARAAAKNRVMNGTAQVNFRLGPRGQLVGQSTILAEGNKYRIGFSFANAEYRGEQIAFDGRTVTATEVRPGVKSNLSAFLYQNGFLLKDGLLGGVTTTNWIFLDLAGRQPKPKIDYTGLKNIDGRKLHELKYQGNKDGSTFVISFYFDPETFHHVLTVHTHRVPAWFAGMPSRGGVGVSQDQMEGFVGIREEFGSFKTVDGLTLPHSYKLAFSVEGGQARSFIADWLLDITQVLHNQPLDAGVFKVQ